MEIKYLVVPEVDPKKVSFSYQLFLDDFVRVCVTSDFRVWTSTIEYTAVCRERFLVHIIGLIRKN